EWMGFDVYTVDRIIGIGEYSGIKIVDGCNGIAAMGLFLGFIIAYPGDRVQKLRSEEHTSELQSRENLVCRLLLEKKKDARLPDGRFLPQLFNFKPHGTNPHSSSSSHCYLNTNHHVSFSMRFVMT